jgi:hypothetical protein
LDDADMSLWLLFVLLSAATFRGTRLIVKDDFPPIVWARNKIQNARPIVWTRQPTHSDPAGDSRYWWLGELVSCHWCTSAYVSAGLVSVSTLWVSIPLPWLWWAGVWAAGAVLVDRLG